MKQGYDTGQGILGHEMEPIFTVDDLLRKYGNRRKRFEAIYQNMFEEAKRLATPSSLQRTFLADELPTLAVYLPGAETITLGICSLGPQLDVRVSTLFNSDPVSAVVLDEIGTRWVKELGREMHVGIRATAIEAGKRASPSYRPGVGQWPLELQTELFAGLPAATIGVRFQNGLMDPQKSISMIVAIGASLGRSRFAPQQTSNS
jgi:hypothetical protein